MKVHTCDWLLKDLHLHLSHMATNRVGEVKKYKNMNYRIRILVFFVNRKLQMMQMLTFPEKFPQTHKTNCSSHLPPVTVGLLQENKPFALPDADLPSISPAVVIVILGLEDHRTAGDPTHRHPPGGYHRCRSRLLVVPHRAPPSPRQHGSLHSPSASFTGSMRMAETGDTGWVGTGQVRLEPGQCHDLKHAGTERERMD